MGGFRAGAICAVYAPRAENRFISPREKEEAELDCIRAGLGAFERLEHMDLGKRQYRKDYWHVQTGRVAPCLPRLRQEASAG